MKEINIDVKTKSSNNDILSSIVDQPSISENNLSLLVEVDDVISMCNNCVQVRKVFFAVSASVVIPMLVFTGLLLTVGAGKLNSTFNLVTATIVQFVFVLLYFQLVIGIGVMIISFVKRRSPVLKYKVWYACLHCIVMLLFITASMLMTAANGETLLTALVLIGGLGYFYTVSLYIKSDSSLCNYLKRIY